MHKLLLAICSAFLLLFTATYSASASQNTLRPLSDMTYLKTSERRPYPNLHNYKHLSVLVKINQNKVFLKNNHQTIYTMYCSAGKLDPKTHKSYTPTGHFVIQPEHGKSFYNAELKEGANYWTSFKDHGVYLFHTVPTDKNGNYKLAPAKLLGRRPDSHGCIRMSIPDAKFMQTLPINTPVTIKR